MLFASYEFIGFLILVFGLYYILPKKCQWPLLLVASFAFYGFSGLDNLFYILATIIVTYLFGIWIDKMYVSHKALVAENKASWSREEKKANKAKFTKRKNLVLLLCIILDIGLLAVVKYTNFFISNVNAVFKTTIDFFDIALPMGISFYIFKSVGYIIDVSRGKYAAEKNPFKFALFVSFFPQLVQGPISRFDELSQSLFEEHKAEFKNISFGLQRILWGFFKKLVIADRILVGVKAIIGDTDTYQGAWVFVGMVFYACELYCDFTGGIDITIGISEVLGIKVAENFVRPFFSKNIKEYWNRWHITMGSWFTDYIFYPLSVSQWMLKLTRKSREKLGDAIGKRVPVYLSAFIVWFATGFWHGASWNFIVWGIGNFVVIMISQELDPFYRWFHSKVNVKGTVGWKIFQVLRTIFIMSSLRAFDCYRDVPLTFKMYGTMLTNFNWSEVFAGLSNLGLTSADYIIVVLGSLLIFIVSMISRRGSVREKIAAKPVVVGLTLFTTLFIITLIFGAYGIGFDSSQFIYNQF